MPIAVIGTQADSASTLRGHYPSYREMLLKLCYKLEIKCPRTLITEVGQKAVACTESDGCSNFLCSLVCVAGWGWLLVLGQGLTAHACSVMQDLETEVLMHILEQQKPSRSHVAIQKASPTQQQTSG